MSLHRPEPGTFIRLLATVGFLILGPWAFAADDDDDAVEPDGPASPALERQVALPAPPADRPQELCVFLHQRGLANLRLARYDEAIADLRQALALGQRPTPDLWCDRWRMQGGLRNAMLAAGDRLPLAEFAQEVVAENAGRNPWRHYGALLWLVDVQLALGQLRQAERSFEAASELMPRLRQNAMTWTNHGAGAQSRHAQYASRLQLLRGNYAEAERFRRQALGLARTQLDTARSRRAADHIDVLHAESQLTDRQRGLANVLMIQSKTGEAEILARQVLADTRARSSGKGWSLAIALSTLGKIKLQQGRIDEALQLQEEALAKLEQAGVRPHSTTLAALRMQIGFLYGVLQRWDDALRIYELRDRGLRSDATQFARTGSNNLTWALALLRNGRADDAEKMLRSLIAHNQRKPFVDPLYFAHLRGYLGLALAGAGKADEALAEFRAAFPVLQKQAQADEGGDDNGFVRLYRLRLIADGYLELLARLAGTGSGQDSALVAEAFAVAETARASSVQEAIVNSAARASLPDPALAELARREQDAGNRIGALNALLVRLAAEPEKHRLDKVIADIGAERVQLEKELADLRRQLAARFPAYADLVTPRPPTPREVQRALQAGEAAIAFYVGERQTHVWTISGSAVTLRAADLPRREVESLVGRLRKGFDLSTGSLPSFDRGAARELYSRLLGPAVEQLADTRVLNIVPHGALGQIPFAVLLEPGADEAWLIRRLALAQQPSVGTLLALRRQESGRSSRRPFVGFGDPQFMAEGGTAGGTRGLRNLRIARGGSDATLADGFAQLPPLPDTREELNEIGKNLGADPQADLYLGARASEANVKKTRLADYRIVAFATHGLVPGELAGIDEPSLALSNPALAGDRDNDGFLTLGEVLGLKLDADWVVLSACNTASGDGRNEEAVSGLGRAFFFAGTRRMLVTYWPVETVSARLLTTELFRRQVAHPAEAKAESLRQAMLKLMAERDTAHPALWAPFGLIGDPLN